MINVIFDSIDMDNEEQTYIRELLESHNVDTDIIALCDVHLWNGHRIALVNISERNNTRDLSWVLNTMMRCHTEQRIELDDTDVISFEMHHDGTNTYIFRKMKKNCSFEKLSNHIDKFCANNAGCTLYEVYDEILSRTKSIKKDVLSVLSEGGL